MYNLHPLFVHFPIALIFVAAACDFIGIVTHRKSFIHAATIATVFAALGAISSVITGLLIEDTVWHLEASHEILETHETIGIIFMSLTLAIAIFRLAAKDKIYDRFKWIAFIAVIVACGVVTYGGYLGGEMVYVYGTGTKEAQQATAKADSLATELDSLKGIPRQVPKEDETWEEHEHHHHQ